MSAISQLVVLLFLLSLLLLAGSSVARRHADTRFRLRRLEARVDRLYDEAGLQGVPEDLSVVRELLAHGQRTKAVRAYRELTGADLIAAKRAVDRMTTDDPR